MIRAATVCLISSSVALATAEPMTFTNVTQSAGIDHNYNQYPLAGSEDLIGGGGVTEDFDRDGWIDIFLTQSAGPGGARLYMNNCDGTFREEASARGVSLTGRGVGVGAAAADFDNDGDADLCVTFLNPPHALLLNDGQGYFSLSPVTLALPQFASTSPSFGDVNNDGVLELAIGQWNRTTLDHKMTVYKNVGGGNLADYEFRAEPRTDLYVFSPRFADVTGDGMQDLLLTADFLNSQLYINTGSDLFVNSTAAANIGHDRAGMGAAVGDYDNDGDLDWFVSSTSVNDDNVGNRLYRNVGDGTFDDVSDAAGVNDGIWGWGASFGDLDLDGDLDIYHVTGWWLVYRGNHLPALLFENQGDGTFIDVAEASGAAEDGDARGLALFDYDNDGDLDMLIGVNGVMTQPAPPVLFRNDTPTDNRWLKVSLAGEPPLHRDGIGSRVYVTTGETTQMRELHASTNYLMQEPGRIAHFGVGDADIIDEVRVEWVNGKVTSIPGVAANQHITISSRNNAAAAWKRYR